MQHNRKRRRQSKICWTYTSNFQDLYDCWQRGFCWHYHHRNKDAGTVSPSIDIKSSRYCENFITLQFNIYQLILRVVYFLRWLYPPRCLMKEYFPRGGSITLSTIKVRHPSVNCKDIFYLGLDMSQLQCNLVGITRTK